MIIAPQQELIKRHILNEYPKEACGFLTIDSFIPAINQHPEPEIGFEISKLDYLANVNFIIAIIHSHTKKVETNSPWDLRTPSRMDILNQRATALPWLIYGTEGVNVLEPIELPRTPNQNYLNRQFLWFINDCWTLVQDFYFFEFGIKLKESTPPENFKKLRSMSQIFNPLIEEYGFERIPFKGKMEKGDLLLLDNEGYRENHLGIYYNGKILHQGLISTLVPVENFIGHINCILKYRGNSGN
jgi:proteasome lid subunit RPN8/RPN11